MKIIKNLRKQRTEAECRPPWYYGATYYEYHSGTQIFYPIPINLLIRFLKTVQYLWNRWRSKPTFVDRQIEKYVDIKCAECFWKQNQLSYQVKKEKI